MIKKKSLWNNVEIRVLRTQVSDACPNPSPFPRFCYPCDQFQGSKSRNNSDTADKVIKTWRRVIGSYRQSFEKIELNWLLSSWISNRTVWILSISDLKCHVISTTLSINFYGALRNYLLHKFEWNWIWSLWNDDLK